MLALRIIAGLLVVAGVVTVLGSKAIAARFGLDQKVKDEDAGEIDEEELKQYKLLKASVNIKIIGMLLATPGVLMTLIVFR